MFSKSIQPARPEVVPGVLVIAALDRDLVSLLRILSETHWNIYWYTNLADAFVGFEKSTVPVVLCDRRLPDGDWRDALAHLESFPKPPALIVTARAADEFLWAEVLNLGGYDLLAKPFDREEVTRVVGQILQPDRLQARAARLHCA